MRSRNVHIQFWLNRKEAEVLDKKVKRSGLSREAYLRHLVSGLEPREAPPADYYGMMREIYAIGKNLNQIAQKAHVLNVMDAQRMTLRCESWRRRSRPSRRPWYCLRRWKGNGNDLSLAHRRLAGSCGRVY